MPEGVGTDGIGYGVNYPVFWIDCYHPHSVKQHTAFVARTKAKVDAFYAAALKVCGTDHGAPGLRRSFAATNRQAIFAASGSRGKLGFG
jgi:hypothetical protein